jgi:hypothetical protein
MNEPWEAFRVPEHILNAPVRERNRWLRQNDPRWDVDLTEEEERAIEERMANLTPAELLFVPAGLYEPKKKAVVSDRLPYDPREGF